jgi:S-formylglutathione hydrolase FrmB
VGGARGPARRLFVLVALIASSLVPCAAARAVTFSSVDGLTVTSVKQLDARLYALTVTTPAIPATLGIRILLPSGYAAHPATRYPVLYLLDGTSGRASDWTTLGDAERTTAGRPLIVVMPDITIDGNGGGWCTNWPNGAQRWETFHIDELVPWVDANLRTRADRGGRAIAGLSQGGFCSTSYAARHPDLFGEALAYSGAPDIAYDVDARLGAMAIINGTELGLTRVSPDTFFGNPIRDYLNWAAHDPATLAENLRHTRLYLYYGNGFPGPLDPPGLNLAGMGIEGAIWEDNRDFKRRLDALHIRPAVYDAYGNGTHTWPYWARDLRQSIGPLMGDFARRTRNPSRFTYQTDAGRYSVYGWSVSMHRGATEFSTLSANARRGFAITGSGTATVITPPMLRPNAAYTVHIGRGRETLTTDASGRLHITVPLGRADTIQEYSLGGPPVPSPGTDLHTTRVTFARV